MKRHLIKAYMMLLLLVFASNSHAVSIYDSITAAVSFTDLIAAMGTVYAGLIAVGIFMIGADKISKRLGWTK